MGNEVPLDLLPDEFKALGKEVPLNLLPDELKQPERPQAEDLSRLERTGRMIAGTAGQMEAAGGQVLQVGGRIAKQAGQGYKDLSEFIGESPTLDLMGTFLEKAGGVSVGAGKAVTGQGRALAEKMAFENPDLFDKVVGAFTSTGVAIIPAIGVVKGASLLKFAPTIARNLGISANVLLESSLEAGAVREELIQSGKSEEEADKAAYKTFFANIPTIAITDKLGVFAKTNTMTGKVARSMLSNAVQEAGQTGISNVATGKDVTEGMAESAGIGAIVGGPFGVMESMAEGKQPPPGPEAPPQAPQTVPLAPNVTPVQLERARAMGASDPIAALKSVTPAAEWANIEAMGREIIQSVQADPAVSTDQKQVISAQVLNRILENSIRPAIPVAEAPGAAQEALEGQEAAPAPTEAEQAAIEQVDVLTKATEQLDITGEDLDALMPDKEAGMKLLADTISTGKEQGKTTEQIAQDFAEALTPAPIQEDTSAMPKEVAIDELRTAAPEERPSVPEAAIQHEADKLTAEVTQPIPVAEEPTFEQGPVPAISEKISGQLEAVGYAAPEAKSNADLISAFYQAEATKRGISVEQYQRENPLPGIVEQGQGELKQGEIVPPFYSKLKQTIEAKMSGPMPAAQLQGMVKAAGIKADELEWFDLDGFMKDNPKPTKAQVLDYLAANTLEIKEVAKTDIVKEATEAQMDAAAEAASRNDNFGYDYPTEFLRDAVNEDDWTKTWEPPTDVKDRAAIQEYVDAAKSEIEGKRTLKTKFSKYQLPGGENYREVLFTLPVSKAVDEARIAELVKISGERQLTPKEFTEHKVLFEKTTQPGFRSSHWSEPNVLAHMRLNDRMVDGKRVLFIEEVQSDWHQKGREVGYTTGKELTAKDATDMGYSVDRAKSNLGPDAYFINGNYETDKRIPNAGFDTEAEAWKALLEHIKKNKPSEAVPSAPLKKTWHEYVMKRAIRMAAEQGYDAIAWTTGEQQAERYDLSKQVDKIAYSESTGLLTAWKDGNRIMDEDATPDKIASYIGKVPAQKLIEAKANKRGVKEISGLDLKVGGEGMAGFYDGMLPAFVNKFTKKWGGRVEESKIPSDKKWMVTFEDKPMRLFNTEAEARDVANRLDGIAVKEPGGDTPVHSLALTPDLKRAALTEGFPLFQGTRGFFSQSKNLIGLLKDKDQSTFAHESSHAWLTDIWQFVKSGKADEAYKKHWEPMAQWLGVTEGQKELTVEQHEKFADGFEAYLREGKAPSTGLARVFQDFRAWLLQIYERAKIGGIELSAEAKAFYDRLLTSQKAEVEAVVSQAKEAQAKGGLVLKQEPVKRTINRATGVTPEKQAVLTDQSKLLRLKLRSEARAAREAARATKAALMEDLRAKTKGEAEIRADAVKYVTDNVPKELRYKALRAIANAKTNIQLGKIIVAADKIAVKAYVRQLAQDIKKVAQRAVDSSKVDVNYKEAVRALMAEIDLVQHRPDTMLRIKAMKEYVETARESGRLQFISENITKALDILTRRPLADISEHELENILRDLHIIELVGREAQAQKEAADSLSKNMWVEDLIKPGIKHIKMSAEAQGLAKAWGWAQDVYWSLAPMDIIADRLDGGKATYDGPHAKMKKIIDGDFLNFLDLKRQYIQPVLELVKKHGLNEADMEKIGIYALKVQANGTERVLASMPELSAEYVNGLTLTPAEMEVYQKMRAAMEATYPIMKKQMGKLYNKEVGSVENYFTMITDWDKLTDMQVEERLSKETEQFTGMKKNVKAGFSKTRQPGAVSPVMVNAMKVYMQHMNDVLYFIAMQENIKKFTEITKDERYQESVGPEGYRIIGSWLDLLARQGRAEGSKRIWAIPGLPSVNIDTLRKNIGAATLGLKLTSIMIQTTSFFDAASYVGGANVLQGLAGVVSDKSKRDWLNKNFPKLRERIGDDLALVDLSEKEWLNKLQQKGYAPMKALDSVVAASTTLAAYQKYADENNIPVDFKGKPDEKAVAYANKVLSKTQASPFFLDAGIMFGSSKYGFGNASINKAFLQFKQFTTNRWFYMSYDVPKMKAGEITQAAFYLGMAQAAEMGIRAGSRAALLSVLGTAGFGIAAGVKGADDDDELLTDYMVNLLGAVPFADSFISAFKYHSLPAPVMDTTAKLFLGPSDMLYAQNEYKKIVALRQTLVALASLSGIPGAAQVGQIATWAYNPNTLTFPYNTELKGLEDLGEQATYGERERMNTLKQAHSEFNRFSKAYRESMAKNDLEAATVAAKEAADVLNKI